MKKTICCLTFITALALSGLLITTHHKEAMGTFALSVEGCNYVTKLPTVIDTTDSSDQEIREYYKSLNELPDAERQGENLLKNLKPILYNMNYFSYDDVWKVYEITDREWSLSPAENDEFGDYNKSTGIYENYVYSSSASKTKNNPYVHTLYRDHSDESGYIKEWDSHNTPNGTNREHVWCQSRGFKADTGASGPAGTDVHHLISGDARVNQTHHNNNPYGFVKEEDATSKKYGEELPFVKNNKRGTALHTSSQDESTVVFEPQDSDKGDIARACFYMVARYNNLSGTDTITQFEPNLTLVNYATSNGESEISSATKAVGMGILQDLLAWHKMDPVDEYEIHRNNLIYKNYQGNRNPFIDFPQWVDAIWGTADKDNYNPNPVGYAKPSSDAINDAGLSVSTSSISLKVDETAKVSATSISGDPIKWDVENKNNISLDKTTTSNNEEVTVKGLKEGKTTITVTSGEFSKEITVYVSKNSQQNFVVYVGIGAAALFVLILLIVIFSNLSKKNKRKMKSAAKKVVKKNVKQAVKNNNKK